MIASYEYYPHSKVLDKPKSDMRSMIGDQRGSTKDRIQHMHRICAGKKCQNRGIHYLKVLYLNRFDGFVSLAKTIWLPVIWLLKKAYQKFSQSVEKRRLIYDERTYHDWL
jgi:hypothetical protein